MTTGPRETATLGGGCFWCIEAVFERLEGVSRVSSGYSGGRPGPVSYRDVCSGATGHAEVVQVTFDPGVLPYRDLLEIFFAFHDPTTPNRQGADAGTQYRSVIFTHTPAQHAEAEQVIAGLAGAGVWDDPIVTEVTPFSGFIAAEEDHQGYYRRNAEQSYCRAVIAPKMSKLRARYAARLRKGVESGTD